MKINQLEIAVAIAENGSLKAAAAALGKTQPSLTKALKQLEAQVGAQLFERSSYGMLPTPLGSALVKRARSVVGEVRQIEDEINQLRGVGTGRLHATISPVAETRIIPPALKRFRRRFPDIDVQILGGHAYSALEPLRQGETDLVIGPAPPESMGHGLKIGPLLEVELCFLTGAQSRFATCWRLVDLQEADWVMFGWAAHASNFHRVFEEHGLPPPPVRTQLQSVFPLASMLQTGHRVALLPQLLAEELIQRWGLARVPILERPGKLQISLMTRAERPLSPAGLVFIDCIRDVAAQLASEARR